MALAEKLAAIVIEGRAVAIHCRAGIGRSSLMAGAVMVIAGTGARDAFAMLAQARGTSVPDTNGQRDWLGAFEQRVRQG